MCIKKLKKPYLRFLKKINFNEILHTSHETWQLVNCFECRLPYTVSDNLCSLIRLKNILPKYILLGNEFYDNINPI